MTRRSSTRWRSRPGQWLLPAILFLAHTAAALTASAQTDHKRVLVMYASRPDTEFAVIAENLLPRLLESALHGNLDYYSEFLDEGRFPDAADRAAFHDYLRSKYRSIRFDLVVSMQDGAARFVAAHRESVFRDAPEVFLVTNPQFRGAANSTGLILERSFAPTLTLLRELQPEVQQVFVVSGANESDKAFEREVRRQLQSVDPAVTLTYLSGLATRELEHRLSALPARSAVYYVLVSEDGAGNRFHPLEYLDRVAAAANAPTYCWVESAMGRGIVGGSLYSQRGVIERIAQLALRVLRGEPPASIPSAVVTLTSFQVDWRQLRRWRIDEARVPAGTRFQFREPTVWEAYKAYILAALALLLLQAALIAGLLIQRTRRRHAEQQLRSQERELRKSYERNRDLGARLLQAQEAEHSRIARELHDDISQRMLLLTIELEAIRSEHADNDSAVKALRVARDVARSLHELSHRLHPTRLQLFGLVSALEQLGAELSRAGTAITVEHENVPPALRPDVMLCLFRVAQEALQNAIKYSSARNVSVELRGSPEELTLTIGDDGVGFDVDAAWRKGLGLVSLEERLDSIGGSFEVRSTAGGGTRLTATVPVRVLEASQEAPAHAAQR